MNSTKPYFVYGGISLAGILIIGLSILTGTIQVTISDLIPILYGGSPLLDADSRIALLQLRLPRIVASFIVGGSLGCAGLALQGLFRNPMAAPGILGVSSGGALGAIFLIQIGYGSLLFTTTGAFLTALFTVMTVYGLATKNGKTPITTLLLAGLAVGAFYTALIGFVLSVADPYRLNRLLFWLLGGFEGVRWDTVLGLIIPVIIGMYGLWRLMEPLNILNTGDTTARSMGVDVEKTKKMTLIWVALLTAAAVSVSGVIGFVGLIVPHVNRMLLEPDHRTLFPVVFLTGGIFLVGADLLARRIIQPAEIRIGIITALAGVPFFLYLLRFRGVEWTY